MDEIIDLIVKDSGLATALKALAKKHYCEFKVANSSLQLDYARRIGNSIFDGEFYVRLRISNDLSTNTKNTYVSITDSDKKLVCTEYCRFRSLESIEKFVTRKIVSFTERRIEVLNYQLSLLKEK